MNRSERNAPLMCDVCSTREFFVHDHTQGTTVCTKCGVIAQSRALVGHMYSFDKGNSTSSVSLGDTRVSVNFEKEDTFPGTVMSTDTFRTFKGQCRRLAAAPLHRNRFRHLMKKGIDHIGLWETALKFPEHQVAVFLRALNTGKKHVIKTACPCDEKVRVFNVAKRKWRALIHMRSLRWYNEKEEISDSLADCGSSGISKSVHSDVAAIIILAGYEAGYCFTRHEIIAVAKKIPQKYRIPPKMDDIIGAYKHLQSNGVNVEDVSARARARHTRSREIREEEEERSRIINDWCIVYSKSGKVECVYDDFGNDVTTTYLKEAERLKRKKNRRTTSGWSSNIQLRRLNVSLKNIAGEIKQKNITDRQALLGFSRRIMDNAGVARDSTMWKRVINTVWVFGSRRRENRSHCYTIAAVIIYILSLSDDQYNGRLSQAVIGRAAHIHRSTISAAMPEVRKILATVLIP